MNLPAAFRPLDMGLLLAAAFIGGVSGGSFRVADFGVAQTAVRPTADIAAAPSALGIVAVRDKLPVIMRDPDGLFRVPAVLNGVPIQMVLDTGATTTVLTEADAARVGLAPSDQDSEIINTASGASSMQWAKLRHVRVGGTSMTNIDVAVVKTGLSTPLMGQNMLDHLGPYTIDRNRLKFGRSES